MFPGFSKLVSLLRQFVLKLAVFSKWVCVDLYLPTHKTRLNGKKGLSSSSSATKKLIMEHSEKDVKTNGYF